MKSQFLHTGNDIRYLVLYIYKRPNFDCELFMRANDEYPDTSLPPHIQLAGNYYWFKQSQVVLIGTHDEISGGRRYLDNTHRDMFHEFVLGQGIIRPGEALTSNYTPNFIQEMVKEYHSLWPQYVDLLNTTDDFDLSNKLYSGFEAKYISGRSEEEISNINMVIPNVLASIEPVKADKPKRTRSRKPKAEPEIQVETVGES